MLSDLICLLLNVYLLVLLCRIVLSWFPAAPGGALDRVNGVLFTLTEPVLGPLRRAIPPVGMFDLSPLVVFIGIAILRGVFC